MLIVFLLTLALQAAAAAQSGGPLDATQAKCSAPAAIVQIDGGKLKGDPVRLAWGEGGEGFFLRSATYDVYHNELGKNYVLPAGGGAPAQVDAEPAWASHYWMWKSSNAAPGKPDFRFDIETREQAKLATGSTSEGVGVDNPNRSDPSQSQIAKDVASMQKIVTTTVRLKGQLITELQNQRIVPGLTWGWAPAPVTALAFVDSKKRLIILDQNGRKLEVEGAKDVLLPAWSPDGKKIAYLQKTGRKKYTLMVVDVQ